MVADPDFLGLLICIAGPARPLARFTRIRRGTRWLLRDDSPEEVSLGSRGSTRLGLLTTVFTIIRIFGVAAFC